MIDRASLRKAMGALGLLAVAAGVAWAQEKPWDVKPADQWTLTETPKLLSNSPWAQIHGQGVPGQLIVPGTLTNPLSFTGSINNPQWPSGMEPPYEVLWLSSRTVGEGLRRLQQLHPLSGFPLKAEPPAWPSPDIVIAVTGDLTPLEKTKEGQMPQYATLEVAHRPKLHPDKIKIFRDHDRVTQAWFYFPRELKGRNVIGPAVGEVNFLYFKVGHAPMKATFKLQEMVRGGKADF